MRNDKGLNFCPTPNSIDKAKVKQDLEAFGRRLRLKWNFRNDERGFSTNPFRKKSTYNPKGSAAIEVYLSIIEGRIMEIADQQNSGFSNLTREEKLALENLKNDKSIIIKSADKGSSVVVWDREDYFKEAEDQLSDDSVYEEVVGDPSPNLALLITDALAKIKDLGVLDQDTLNFLEPDDPKLGRFYLLPKIHKRF